MQPGLIIAAAHLWYSGLQQQKQEKAAASIVLWPVAVAISHGWLLLFQLCFCGCCCSHSSRTVTFWLHLIVLCTLLVPSTQATPLSCSGHQAMLKTGTNRVSIFLVDIFVAFPTAWLSITRVIAFHGSPAQFFDLLILLFIVNWNVKNIAGLLWNTMHLVIESDAVGKATKISMIKNRDSISPCFQHLLMAAARWGDYMSTVHRLQVHPMPP